MLFASHLFGKVLHTMVLTSFEPLVQHRLREVKIGTDSIQRPALIEVAQDGIAPLLVAIVPLLLHSVGSIPIGRAGAV